MQTGYMILEVELPNNEAAQIEGPWLKYWRGEGLPAYDGPLNDAPPDMIEALLEAKAIVPA